MHENLFLAQVAGIFRSSKIMEIYRIPQGKMLKGVLLRLWIPHVKFKNPIVFSGGLTVKACKHDMEALMDLVFSIRFYKFREKPFYLISLHVIYREMRYCTSPNIRKWEAVCVCEQKVLGELLKSESDQVQTWWVGTMEWDVGAGVCTPRNSCDCMATWPPYSLYTHART